MGTDNSAPCRSRLKPFLLQAPCLRTLATVCILSLTIQVAAPLFASSSVRWGKRDSFFPYH